MTAWYPVNRVNEMKEIHLLGKTFQTEINHTFYLLTVTEDLTSPYPSETAPFATVDNEREVFGLIP